jgi:putative ABC transport system permease protein
VKYAAVVLANFKRHKLRTLLTILSIVVAFVLFGYLSAIRNAFQMGVSMAGADRLIVRNKITLIQPLPQSYEARIEAIPGVADATQAAWFGGIYKDVPNAFPQIAVKPDEFLAIYKEFVLSPAQKDAWKRTKTGAVAGRKLAMRYGWKIGQRIPIRTTYMRPKKGGDTWTFDLVGIYTGANEETDESQFFLRHDYLDENRFYGQGKTGWYYIKVKDPSHAEQIGASIDERFANSSDETKTETEKAFVKGFAEQMGNIGAITTAIVTAAFFTILLVVGNTMAQAVRERTRELGVMKAIGFTDGQVLSMVLFESMMVALVGGAVGLLLGWLLVRLGDPSGGALPIFRFPVADVVLGIALTVGLGFITGAIPAFQAMRLNPVDALRRE